VGHPVFNDDTGATLLDSSRSIAFDEPYDWYGDVCTVWRVGSSTRSRAVVGRRQDCLDVIRAGRDGPPITAEGAAMTRAFQA
jgi:hypothetical protein